MLAKADVDGKGYVDLDDFYNVITGKTYSWFLFFLIMIW